MSASIILLLICGGFAFIGGIFLIIAIILFASAKKKRKNCTQIIRATVVDMERSDTISMDGMRMVSWYPVYEYRINGKVITKRSYIGSARQDFYPGQMVTLYVNPENVNEFYCPEEKTGMIRKIFGFVGALLIVLSIIISILMKKVL